jgi:predicted negative regulator of RcsB-dependent stress response
MAPINLLDRSQAETVHLLLKRADLHQLVKRKNWAARNPGVVLVFCIVFLVALGLVALVAYRRWLKRKANKETYETTE